MRRGAGLLVCGAAMVLGFGCAGSGGGYSFTPAYRQDIKTIAVPIFDNSTFSHGMELALTDALIKEVHRTTPWRVAPVGTAQTTLRGTITNWQLHQLSRERESGLGQEMAVVLTVSFEWKDNATGEVLVGRRNFRATDTFVPTQPVGERLELGEQAATERLARSIVAQLRSSW